MIKTILAALSILLMTAQAQALCVPQPDNAASNYVSNSVAQTMCLNNELADTQRRTDQKAQIDSLRADTNHLILEQKLDHFRFH